MGVAWEIEGTLRAKELFIVLLVVNAARNINTGVLVVLVFCFGGIFKEKN